MFVAASPWLQHAGNSQCLPPFSFCWSIAYPFVTPCRHAPVQTASFADVKRHPLFVSAASIVLCLAAVLLCLAKTEIDRFFRSNRSNNGRKRTDGRHARDALLS